MIARPQTNGSDTAPPAPGSVRVAAYTRQSVTKNESEVFGSTVAQREAIAAYVASQKANGWVLLEAHYDDTNASGATMDRPAFQRLLQDVEAGKIDLVATYKIDRLSRSLSHFTRLMSLFEERGVGFCSITQSFDTRTSMGRLTLNILASFAEFEREQSRERVRDKTRASRKRGMWTGGAVPLGYRSVDKRLVIDSAGADTVRIIVAAYLATGSLTATLEVLRERGVVAKGGARFTVATLRILLRSPLIGGRINAGDKVVRAEHKAILDEPTWEALQLKLAGPEPPVRRHRRVRSGALLANLVHCGRCGATWSAHYTAKLGGKRYGAYTCQSIIRKSAKACPGSRVPAHALETFVIEKVRAVGRDTDVLREAVAAAGGELKTQRDALAAQVKRLDADVKRLKTEQAALLDTVQQAGKAVPELIARLDTLRGEVEVAEAGLKKAKAELAGCKRQTIDEGELRQAIASFDGVWQHLFPAERQRILRLLIECIVVKAGADGEDVAITYSAEGARTLITETTQETP